MSSGNKSPFWKTSSSKSPGGSKISPANNYANEIPSKHKLTFKEFERNTEDAWDASDDDFLREAIGKIKIHPEHVVESAKAVLENYTKYSSGKVINVRTNCTKNNISNDERESTNHNSSRPNENEHSKTPQGQKLPGGATRKIESSPQINKTVTNKITQKNNELKDSTKPQQVIQGESNSKSNSNEKEKSVISTSMKQVQSPNAPQTQSIRSPIQSTDSTRIQAQITKFNELLNGPNTDIVELRNLSWSGIPKCVRPDAWRILCDYLPANKDRREKTLERKRQEYFNFVRDYYEKEKQGMHKETFHQIHIDIPRTNPLIPLFQQPAVQNIFERLLFVWAIRHPASGYVQGINDLVTPFFVVFLSQHIAEGCDVETYEVGKLDDSVLRDMEADTYWCTTKLLDGIQDNYTFAQPGVQTKVQRLQGLIQRIDVDLHSHLINNQVEYLQFAFRWMNNLLMREIPLRCTIRLWDTYIAETEGFSDFHLYVCVAFLRHWRNQLLDQNDFQGLLLSLQNFPTAHWADEEINLLLAEAFRLRYTYSGAQSHLGSS